MKFPRSQLLSNNYDLIRIALIGLLIFVATVAVICVAGCQGVIAANGITAASETAAGAALQAKVITVSQLSSLANDLPGVASGTALTAQDNAVIAQVLAELAKNKANLTDASAIDGINNAIAALNSTTSPTAMQGVVWSDLMDVAAGFKAEVKFAQANPQLLTP